MYEKIRARNQNMNASQAVRKQIRRTIHCHYFKNDPSISQDETLLKISEECELCTRFIKQKEEYADKKDEIVISRGNYLYKTNIRNMNRIIYYTD